MFLSVSYLALRAKFLKILQKSFGKYFINEEIAVTLHGCSDMVPTHKILCHPQGASKQIKIMMLMNKNPFYAAPEAELLVVRFEGNFMGTGDPGTPGTGGYGDNPMDDLGD